MSSEFKCTECENVFLVEEDTNEIICPHCGTKYTLDIAHKDSGTDLKITGGMVGGAIFGASVGGPVGALIGAFVGGLISAEVNKERKDD